MSYPTAGTDATKHPPIGRAAPTRRTFQLILLFVVSVLVANAVIGERGLLASRTASQAKQQLAADIAALRAENDRLRIESRGLQSDPSAIEAAARQDLGLIRPGEVIFLLQDGPDVSNRAPHRR